MCHPSAFPLACLAEATRIAPLRNRASDGICGDAHHATEISDHNPAPPNGVPHAFDVTQDPAHFDAHAYGLDIAARVIAGTERRVKYLVSNYGHGDVIFDPSVSHLWWPNPTGNAHASHLHVSFLYDPGVEQSTAPFFELEEPVTQAEIEAVAAEVVRQLTVRDPVTHLSKIGEEVVHVFGGYPDPHGPYDDGAIITDYRKNHGLSQA